MSTNVGRRARKLSESRNRMIECAAALFAEHDYASTSMDAIAECADVSRATVFNYFARKEDLVIAWFDNKRADLAETLNRNEHLKSDAENFLRLMFRALANIFKRDPKTGRGMVRAWLQAGGPLLTPDSDTTHLFADAIRAGQDQGVFAREVDAGQVGHMLFDAYMGVLLRWVTAKRPPDIEKNLLSVLEIILTGIAAPGASQNK